jgi:hypothetical protein
MAAQLTCNRMPIRNLGMPDCHKPQQQQQSVRWTDHVEDVDLARRCGRWGVPRGVESREITQQRQADSGPS